MLLVAEVEDGSVEFVDLLNICPELVMYLSVGIGSLIFEYKLPLFFTLFPAVFLLIELKQTNTNLLKFRKKYF